MQAQLVKRIFVGAFIFVISMFTMDWSMQKGLTVSMQSAEARDGRSARSHDGRSARSHHGNRHNSGNRHRDYRGDRYDHNYNDRYRHRTHIGVGGAILIGSFISTLPRNCVKVYAHGNVYYQCGPNYYRPSGRGYIVVDAP
jgi:hypothetical protein